MVRGRFARVGVVAIAAGALLVGVLPSAQADAPSVTTVEVNGKPIKDGEAKGKVKDSLTATGTAELPEPELPSPVADAGDSQFVEAGTSADLAGLVSGGTDPYEIAWSIDGDDSRFDDATAIEPTLTTEGLPAGPLTVTLDVTDANGRTGSDTVLLELYERFEYRVLDEQVDVLVFPTMSSIATRTSTGRTARSPSRFPPGRTGSRWGSPGRPTRRSSVTARTSSC